MINNIKYKSNELPPLCNLRNLRNLRIKNNKGFTLIEIIIVIIVLGVLSVFGFSFLSTAIHTYSMMEKQKGLYDEAAMAMERVSRELRDASTITTATGSTLEFTKSHGTDEDSDTSISFELSGTTLQRLGTTTVNLADNVSTFDVERGTVANGDEDGITISLTLESGDANITLQSYIYPKNLDCEPYEVDDVIVGRKGRNFGGNWEEDIQ